MYSSLSHFCSFPSTPSLPHIHLCRPSSLHQKPGQMYTCCKCPKTYTTHSGLRKHMISHHTKYSYTGTISCKEPDCTFACKTLNQLRAHLKGHNIHVETERHTFSNLEGMYIYMHVSSNTIPYYDIHMMYVTCIYTAYTLL